ncbi:MAG: FAD-binding oxidoreductase [Cytophagales bacterium]|nr:MAG: FAD-binding oxidoreductase [Cytophagales bacterium]
MLNFNPKASLSFWETSSLLSCDYLIVGSGLVGLSAAAELKGKYPNANVKVLERGLLPTGASTKNAGFACFGSLTELLADLRQMSPEEALELVEDRWEGLRLLRARVGDAAMDYEPLGGYELFSEKELPALEQLEAMNTMLRDLFKTPVFEHLPQRSIAERCFSTQKFKALVYNSLEGQLDTGQMMKTLLEIVLKLGVVIHTGAEVLQLEETGQGVLVHTQDLSNTRTLCFRASTVLVCTNGFSKRFNPDWDLAPGRGQVLITEPIPNLAFRGAYHLEEGYFYFRNVQNRILLGGGRHLAREQERVTDLEVTDYLMGILETILYEDILPQRQTSKPIIEHRWAGIMCFSEKTPTKKPILESLSKNVLAAIRLNGMGVAVGSRLAQRLVDMVTF